MDQGLARHFHSVCPAPILGWLLCPLSPVPYPSWMALSLFPERLQFLLSFLEGGDGSNIQSIKSGSTGKPLSPGYKKNFKGKKDTILHLTSHPSFLETPYLISFSQNCLADIVFVLRIQFLEVSRRENLTCSQMKLYYR